MKVVAALFAFLAVAHSICPNSCNPPHGSCVSDKCVCTGNWNGDDCSIYDQYLNSGEIARDGVTTGSWKFYRHTVGSGGATLIWWMNQTESATPDPWDDDPDGDLYIQFNEYPTRSNYLLRNVTIAKDNILRIENAQRGVYYAGVFGYSSVHYSISVTETMSCPNNCYGNGECLQGECRCFANFGGVDCEYMNRRLTSSNPLIGEVGQYSWEFFNTQVTVPGSTATWTVSELSTGANSNSDCDMYLAFNRLPSLWDWDYANVTIGDESTIKVTNTQVGRYFLGVYGYTQCSFRATVAIDVPQSGCPNQCSDHGTCLNGECRCYPGFQGDTCEWMDPALVLDHPQSGFVGRNAWNYYNTRVVTQSALVITLTQENSGDCDLYVRADDKPTRFEFDYVDLSLKETYSIIIREPGDHTWYMGVFGWESCKYTIVLDEALICACGLDNPHGECREGYTECFCKEGWTGETCNVRLSVLENKVKQSSSVKKFEWKYFEVPISNSTTGVISLKEKSSTGLLWLFVSFTGTPTLSSYDLSEKETNRGIHEIAIATALPQSRTLHVGVYGNPYGTHADAELPFDLVSWSAPF